LLRLGNEPSTSAVLNFAEMRVFKGTR